MKVLPLVIHGSILLPQYTALFSDALAVASIDVAQGGLVTLNCAAAHGVPTGQNIAVSITNAPTPNPIVSATLRTNGDVELETEFDHNLTQHPNTEAFLPWDGGVTKLSGFTSSLMNGGRQLVEVIDRRIFVVKPGGSLVSVTLNGAEALLEPLEFDVIGWHSVTAASATKLAFPTPATVERDYTIASPTVVRNIRIFGALDLAAAMAQFTEDSDTISIDAAHMFVCPSLNVRASRSQHAQTDMVAELSAGSDYRQLLMDGFDILVALPTRKGIGHVEASDLAHGPIFKAILKTFMGLNVRMSEFADFGGSYIAHFEQHGPALTDNRAVYVHRYTFVTPAYLTNADAIAPWEWPLIDDEALQNGTVPDSVTPIGAPEFRDLDFTGILRNGSPQPLFGSYRIDD